MLNANDFSEYIYGRMFGGWDKNMFGCYRTNGCNWDTGGNIITLISAIQTLVIYFWNL